MVQCPQCEADNSDGAHYCSKCGTALTATGGQQVGGAAIGGQQAGGPAQKHPSETGRQQPQGGRQQQTGGGGPGQVAGAPAGRPSEQSRRNILLASGAVVSAAAGGWYFFMRDNGGGEETEIRAVIQKQFEAFENGDIARYMETMHPESPVYDETQTQLESVFAEVSPESLTVEYTIESLDMLSEQRAEAEVVQTTRAESENFRDNRVTQIFEMETYQGEWLLYDTTIIETEYL